MAILAPQAGRVQPHPLQAEIVETRYPLDRLRTWIGPAPAPKHLQALKRSCGSYWDRDGLIEPARFDKGLVYCIDAKQPSAAYLDIMEEIEQTGRVYINHFQPARDEYCIGRKAMWRVKEFRHIHEIRKWHQKGQQLRHFIGGGDNDYDAGREAARMLTHYCPERLREQFVVRSEFRCEGGQSVKRAGIFTIRDVRNFDDVTWWQMKTALLTLPDFRRLGRMLRNREQCTRSRESPIEVWQRGRVRLEFDIDWRRGYEAWLACGVELQGGYGDDSGPHGDNELQHLVDEFGMGRLVQAGVVQVIGWVHAATCDTTTVNCAHNSK